MRSFITLDSEEGVGAQTGRPGWAKPNKNKLENEALVCWATGRRGLSEERPMKSEC